MLYKWACQAASSSVSGPGLMFQFWLTSRPDIHRLGRTARAGQTGTGLLLLASYEQFFLQNKGIRELSVEPWVDSASENDKVAWRQAVADAMDRVEKEPKEQAYQVRVRSSGTCAI